MSFPKLGFFHSKKLKIARLKYSNFPLVKDCLEQET